MRTHSTIHIPSVYTLVVHLPQLKHSFPCKEHANWSTIISGTSLLSERCIAHIRKIYNYPSSLLSTHVPTYSENTLWK